jgi:hypothetical protein
MEPSLKSHRPGMHLSSSDPRSELATGKHQEGGEDVLDPLSNQSQSPHHLLQPRRRKAQGASCLQDDILSHQNSCARADAAGLHLHVLIDDTRVVCRRGEEKHERTLFLEVVAVAIASTPTKDT